MKRVVVIGDVSARKKYHLGDEAMTEVAIDQLRHRNFDVTLIAGDAKASYDMYGVRSVPRFGYIGLSRPSEKHKQLEKVLSVEEGELSNYEWGETVRAVRSADAVVIAGGGNLNSGGEHHIYDRVTLKRLAEASHIPLFVTSQTVGPHLSLEHRKLVLEIVEYASVFGVREPASLQLLEHLGVNEKVVRTYDDGVLLTTKKPSDEVLSEINLPDEYIVASFTYHSWSTGLNRSGYYQEVANALEWISHKTSLPVLLLPHMGSLLKPKSLIDDVAGHAEIARLSNSANIIPVRMLSAKELLWVTEKARFTISSRYHPLVFGAAVDVVPFAMVTSYYSAVRMRGALENIGLRSLAIPFEMWNQKLAERVVEAWAKDSTRLERKVSEAGATAREFQSQWWDEIARAILSDEQPQAEGLTSPQQYQWGDERDLEILEMYSSLQKRINLDALNLNMARRSEKQKAAEQSSSQLNQLTAEVQAQNKELTRLHQEIAEIRHKIRPPGKEIRDWIHRTINRKQ